MIWNTYLWGFSVLSTRLCYSSITESWGRFRVTRSSQNPITDLALDFHLPISILPFYKLLFLSKLFSESRHTQNQSHVLLFCFFNRSLPQAQIITKTAINLHFADKNTLAYMIYLPFLLAPNVMSKVLMGVAILILLQVLEFWLTFLGVSCNVMNSFCLVYF